ncbi:MAG: helix-turn-helix domain-containing protein [Bacteroidales bacterium]|nr:helix-turn-helix domain-containing protein [Bacteroidales bacterium]
MYNNNIKHREAAQLTAYLNTLSRFERARFIKWVAEECGVSRATVYSWRYMCCRIPDFAKEIIEKCADKEIFIEEETEDNDKTETGG